MKVRWILMLTFGVGCLASGGVPGVAEATLRPPSLQRAAGQDPAPRSYPQRAEAARDLEEFQGGRQVIIATDYDVHIMVAVLVIAAVVILILLV
jgi:hypothetical protein